MAQMWPSAWAKKSLDLAQPSKNSGPGGSAPAEFFSLPIPGLEPDPITAFYILFPTEVDL